MHVSKSIYRVLLHIIFRWILLIFFLCGTTCAQASCIMHACMHVCMYGGCGCSLRYIYFPEFASSVSSSETASSFGKSSSSTSSFGESSLGSSCTLEKILKPCHVGKEDSITTIPLMLQHLPQVQLLAPHKKNNDESSNACNIYMHVSMHYSASTPPKDESLGAFGTSLWKETVTYIYII